MQCTKCPFESESELAFAYANTEKMDEPLCIPCFTKEVERRIKKVEQTLHKKSCMLCQGKEYANNLFSIASAPMKLICKSCIDCLHLLVVKEKVDAELLQ